jgi:hypothetical protein
MPDDIVVRLLAMQRTLRTVVQACNAAAAACDSSGEKGLAFATYMVGESLSVWNEAIERYSLKGVADACDDEF